jgi:hypothetical protein
MKQGAKQLLLLILGCGLTYLGITGMLKDASENYVVLSDNDSDSSSLVYLIIGVLLILIPVLGFVKEYRSNKQRTRY